MGDVTYESKVESVWDMSPLHRSVSVESSSLSSLPYNIATYMYDLFKRGKYTDVELAVKKNTESEWVTYSAHKLILSLWSSYFADKFNGPNRKMENIVEYMDVDPTAFEAVLRFMYGIHPNIRTCREALEIYKVSDRFGIQYFKTVSRNIVKEFQPAVINVFEVLEAAIYMDIQALKESCLKVIEENTIEVFESIPSDKFTQISASIIGEILNLQKLSLRSEYALIEWIFRWAKSQFYGVHSYSSIREVLEDFLPKLHFTSLSGAEFAQFYKIHEVFFDQDEAFKILMNIALRNSLPLPEWQDSEFNFRVYTGQRPY